MKLLRISALIACCLCPALAQHVGVPTDDLDKLSAQELFSVQVTSVGRKAQKLSKAPAAVFVLTAEDIRRSGATCIPEALQWVPGMTVLRIDGRSWVVSVRGGARLYADKILVMIDGRSLYTPMFSGVIWDSLGVSMSDIEQIEVVRGPAAVMWGPNAVNGVVNIITRHTRETKGGQLSVAAGNELRNSTEARWGAAPSDRLSYRVWGQFDYRTPAYGSQGYFRFNDYLPYRDPSIQDLDEGTGRVGFRVEGQPNERNHWMLQGDGYRTGRQDPSTYPVVLPSVVERIQEHTDYEGGNIQAKWTHTDSPTGESELQFAFARDEWNYPFLQSQLNNLTVDYQKRAQAGERNEVYWGIGYQQYWDETAGGTTMSFSPSNFIFRSGDVVFRDEWQFVPGRWTASAGIRLDYSTYRQLEYQPSLRLLYTPNARQSAWVGVSRAVRAPSRLDRNSLIDEGAELTGPYPISVQMHGNSDFRSEVERGLEAGYRLQSGQRWSVDVSTFWSYYERLRLLNTPQMPQVDFSGPEPELRYVLSTGNGGVGRSYGGEIWGSFQIREHWRIIPSYSYLNETRWLPPASDYRYYWDGTPARIPHQGLLRSEHDLTRSLRFDLMVRARSHDSSLDLPGAVLVDARLAWRPTRSGELSATARDLTNCRVLESYSEMAATAIPLRRTFMIRWTQRF